MEIQSANKQHPVPQNVMDVEFKLIGELTIRQFSYLVVFALLTFGVGATGMPIIFKYPLILVLVLMGLGFAFFPYNEITLDKWVANYVRAIFTPRIRVWKHSQTVPYYFTLDTTKNTKKDTEYRKQYVPRGSIDDLIKAQGTSKAKDFSDESDLQEREEEFFSKLGLSTSKDTEPIKGKKTINIEPQIKTKEVIEDENDLKENFSSIAINTNKDTFTKEAKPTANPNEQNNDLPNKLTNQTTQTDTSDDEALAEDVLDYQQHIRELNLLKQQLITDIEKSKYKLIEGQEKEIEDIKKDPKAKELAKQNKKLKQKIEKLQQGKKTKNKDQNSLLSQVFSKLQKSEKPTDKQSTLQKSEEIVGDPKKVTDAQTIRSKIKRSSKNYKYIPIKGRVVDEGDNLIPDVIVIIKNLDQEPLRALKTNKLGEFESSTPIEQDEYLVEAIKEGYQFSTIKVNTSDIKDNPVKLVGKRVQ